MKKAAILLILLLFLSGCSGAPKEMEQAMALRSRLLKASSCGFDAKITADYGDKLYDFAMACTADSQGGVTFTVKAPESIAGISGLVAQGSGKLTFDDTALQFDLMADGQISPISGPWVLVKTLRSGCITSACTEEGRVRLTVDDSYEDDALHLDIWLDGEGLPSQADIRFKDRRIVSLAIENFVIT